MPAVFFDNKTDIPDLRYDEAFKAVFARGTPQSRKALSGLLSACIGRKVSVLSLTANEPAPSSAWDKQIRYDIACRLRSGELADVEITLHSSPGEPLREEYFAAKLFVSQDIRGSKAEYLKLKNIYQINILAQGKRYKDMDIVHCFRLYDAKNGLSFDGRMHIITVELSKARRLVRDKAVKDMEAAEVWAVFLRYHTDKSKRALVNEILKKREDIAMAGETALEFSKEELEYFHNMSKLKYELDEQDRKARMKRLLREGREKAMKKGWKEGLAEGREKGLAEGRKRGLAEGREKGLAEGQKRGLAEGQKRGLVEGQKKGQVKGRTEANRRTARKMKAYGDPVKKIADVTGLSPEEIEKL